MSRTRHRAPARRSALARRSPRRRHPRRSRVSSRYCARRVSSEFKIWSGARDLNPGPHGLESDGAHSNQADSCGSSSILPVDPPRTIQIWMNLQPDYYIEVLHRSGPRAFIPNYAPARPRNTTIARPSRTMSSSLRRPIGPASLARWTVVILSTMMLLRSLRPFAAIGSIASRIKGASVGSVVNAHTVMESVASKRSSWITTIGRGLPV